MAEFSPAYETFHLWLRSNRSRICADKDKTVIYSGMTAGGMPIWKLLPERAEQIKLLFGVDPAWIPIEAVLRAIKMDLGHVAKSSTKASLDHFLPSPLYKSMTVWDFACFAAARKWVTPHENKQVWKLLSLNYVKNAKGKVWMFEGKTLKKFPDFLLAEIPVLLRNGAVDQETRDRAMRFAPKSADAWSKCRKTKDPGKRLAGR